MAITDKDYTFSIPQAAQLLFGFAYISSSVVVVFISGIDRKKIEGMDN